jgi:hypothetical protein
VRVFRYDCNYALVNNIYRRAVESRQAHGDSMSRGFRDRNGVPMRVTVGICTDEVTSVEKKLHYVQTAEARNKGSS